MSEFDRPARTQEPALFDVGTGWEHIWKGMPEYSMKDVSPYKSITVNFVTVQDYQAFAARVGQRLSANADSMWYPQQKQLSPGRLIYSGEKFKSRYPVCIPSKGRAQHQRTGKALDQLGVDYKFFVEQHEYDAYCEHVGESRVVSMPFSNLGQGSIPARNFIWDYCKERGHRRHWTVDDNIQGFVRCTNNRRLRVRGGAFFLAMEEFVDRYENVVMAGPHHLGFMPDRCDSMAPYLFNSRVYSCILLDTTLPHRWRGRYNEDTDLSLRLLKDGYCTLLFRALLMNKGATHIGASTHMQSKSKPMAGGNTDNVYTSGNYRLDFAKSLQEQHPDCVEVVWKYGRYHHQVDYSAFESNKPILKPGVVIPDCINNYGMTLEDRDANDADESIDDRTTPPDDIAEIGRDEVIQ